MSNLSELLKAAEEQTKASVQGAPQNVTPRNAPVVVPDTLDQLLAEPQSSGGESVVAKPESGQPAQPVTVSPPTILPTTPLPTAEPSVEPTLDSVLQEQSGGQVGDPSLGEVFSGAVQRGAAQVASSVPGMAGIIAEATGDLGAAESYFNDYQAINNLAPEPVVGSFTDVHNLQDLSRYVVEGFGEQAPVLLALLSGAGTAAGLTTLVGKGVIKSTAARAAARKYAATAGGVGVGFTLEASDSGGELKQATGSWNPGTALSVGAVNSALEWYTPYRVSKLLGAPGQTLTSVGVRGLGTEGATELTQEVVTSLGRAIEDQSYDFWSKANAVRVLDAGLKGAIVGGGVATGGQAVAQATGTTTAGMLDLPEPMRIDVPRSWDNPLAWLRRKYLGKGEPTDSELFLVNPINQTEDYSELSALTPGLRATWDSAKLQADQISHVLDFEDAKTPRYVAQLPDGSYTNPLTHVDLQERLVELPQNYKPKVYWTDLRSMMAGRITAEVKDLPPANSPRVFFAPWVKAKQKAALLEQYAKVAELSDKAVDARLSSTDPEAKALLNAQIAEAYKPLVAQGLRVIPSRGSSFIYSGDITGVEVKDYQFNLRPEAVRSEVDPTLPIAMGARLRPPEVNWLAAASGMPFIDPNLEHSHKAISLDPNKLEQEDGYAVTSLSAPTPELFAAIEQSPEQYILFRKGLSVEEKAALTSRLLNAIALDSTEELHAVYTAGASMREGPFFSTFVAMRDIPKTKFIPGVLAPSTRNRSFNYNLNMTKYEPGSYEVRAGYGSVDPKFTEFKEILIATRKGYAQIAKKLGLPDDFKLLIMEGSNGQSSPAYHPNTNVVSFGLEDIKQWIKEHDTRPGGFVWGKAAKEDLAVLLQEVFMHEVGHYISFHTYQKLPFDVKMLVMSGYNKALLAARTNKDKSWVENYYPGGNAIEYNLTIEEYLAEQFRRWAGSNAQARTELDKFYKATGSALRRYYSEYVKEFGETKAVNILYPSWEFTSMMEYLRTTADTATTVGEVRKARKALPAEYEVPLQLRGLWEQTQNALVDFGKLFPPGTVLQQREQVKVDPDGVVFAEYNSADKIVTLFVGSFAAVPGEKTPRQVVVHEAAHAVAHKFTPEEMALLVEDGIRAQVIDPATVQSYRNDFRKEAEALGLDFAEASAYVAEQLNAEYFAHMLESRVNGKSYSSAVNRVLDAILQLLVKVSNLLMGRGFNSVDSVVDAFFRGEITKRADVDSFTQNFDKIMQSRLRLLVGDERRRRKSDDLVRVEKVSDRLYVAVEAIGSRKDPDLLNYSFYGPPAGELSGTMAQQHQQLGEYVGMVETLNKTHTTVGGWEVDFVEVAPELRRQGFAREFYAYVERVTGTRMAPSGVLYNDGYKMWKARDPQKIMYHVHDPIADMWYSPNRVMENLNNSKLYLAKLKSEKNILPARVQLVTNEVRKWEYLRKKVDSRAWTDPLLKHIYSKSAKSSLDQIMQTIGELGLRQQGVDIVEGRLVRAVTGEETGKTVSAYEEHFAQAQHQSKRQNANKLNVPLSVAAPQQPDTIGVHKMWNNGWRNPVLAPHLRNSSTIPFELDRISWFSKVFMGIQQIAWRNEHIGELRRYVNSVQAMNAYRMRQITKADETAKKWDRELPDAQREALGELLFWLTEMRYRSRQEIAQGVVRQPTAVELAQQMQRLRLEADAQALYGEIKQQFDDFLVEVETISAAQLQRTFSANPVGLQAALRKLQADMQQMRSKPYFPFMRFGRWSLTFRDGQGNVEWFSTYATQNERDAVARQLATTRFVGSMMQVGKVPDEVMEFQGLPGPLIERILDPASGLPGLTAVQQKWLQEFKVQNSPENSFRKRWLERKGTPGYSLDAFRVFSSYFLTGSNYLARLKYKDEIKRNIDDLRAQLPLLSDTKSRVTLIETMESHYGYIMEGGRDFGKLKALISMWQLGFSPAAAFMNMTQTPSVTLPYLAGIYGYGKSLTAVTKALNSVKRLAFPKPQNYNLQFEAGRLEMQRQGKLDVGQAPELGSYAEGSNLSRMVAGDGVQRRWRQLSFYSMWMFGKMEQMNREIAFSAAWDLALTNPNSRHLQEVEQRNLGEVNRLLSQTYDIEGQQVSLTYDQAIAVVAAREAIDRTQFVFQPWARPKFLQNRYASVFLVFFSYVQAMTYAFGNNPGQVPMLLTALALYGMMGLPGAEDADELLKLIGRLTHKWFGKDFSIEKHARDWLVATTEGTPLEQVGPDLFLHGISRYSFGPGLIQEGYGVPQFDASANGSLGRLVPGLAKTAQGIGNGSSWQDITANLARDSAGAGFGQMFALMQFLQSDPFSADAKKWEKVLPRAAKAAVKAHRMYTTGQEVDQKGMPIVKFDPTDPDDLATIVTQALGFSSTKVNQVWEAKEAYSDTEKWLEGRKATIAMQYDHAIRTKDMLGVKDAREAVLRFNREVRESGYPTMGFTADSLKQSLRNRATARERDAAGLPPEKSRIQLQQSILRQYPGAAKVIEEKKVR